MSHTDSRLEKGKYAISSHALCISGDIADVFTGIWKETGQGRALIKCDGDIVGGELMCVIKLRRPMTIPEYREYHHPNIRPLVKSPETDNDEAAIVAVLLPSTMVCTIPDFMEIE